MVYNPELNKLLKSLIGYYHEEKSLYKLMLKISKDLGLTIENNNIEKMNKLLTERGKLINKIDKLKDRITNTSQQIGDILNLEDNQNFISNLLNLDFPYRAQLKEDIRDIYQITQEINNLDIGNKKKLRTKKDQVKSELFKIKRGNILNRSYHSRVDSYEGRFIDKKK
ncbi:hypothetical protein BX659_104132 [Orenia metallireducens]|uniref:FlgN protein n=1 Tax=Orenia metallireducens TaxID=1413210 RepID=A0A285GBT8_9FIRM|nr:flagellar export chaperone FlgN [Orenia metallireducens]PRX32583.1 hypothetical protein BX659_104132 [Orenia metallireducens]SNY20773.1 hypothetical protein SAMN06265827_10616 [Orenia metallireducens]